MGYCIAGSNLTKKNKQNVNVTVFNASVYACKYIFSLGTSKGTMKQPLLDAYAPDVIIDKIKMER